MRRRYLINALLTSGIAATAASILYPILRFVIPPEAAESAVAELVKTRVMVHAFDPGSITDVTKPAMDIATAAHKTADAALEEVAFRRRGLGYALIVIAITIIALIFKIREIEYK